MPVDPSIPLSYAPSSPVDIQKMMTLADLKKKGDNQNALRNIFKDSANLDPATGLPNRQALQQIMSIDPITGMKVAEDQVALQQQIHQGKQKEFQLYQPLLKDTRDALANTLQPRIDKFGLDQAIAMSKGDYAESMKSLKAQGMPDYLIQSMPQELNPSVAQALISGSVSPEKKADLAQRDKSEARQVDLEKERERHDRETERLMGDRITGAADAAGKKGWSLFQDETGNSFRTNANSGKSQKMSDDGEWEDIPKLPVNLRRPGTAPAGTLDMNDPADVDYIKAIANYRVKPPTSGRNLDYRKKVIEAALKENSDYAEGKYDQATKALKDFGTGKQGDTARSLNVSVSHLSTLRDLGEALKNGDVKLINAAKQAWQEQFGTPAPTNFNTAKSIVADEVAKGVIGGTTAQSDRETLAASLKSSGAPEVINGAIDTFQELLGGQLGGLRDQYKRTTGANDFNDSFLSERTRKALKVGDSGENKAAGDVEKKGPDASAPQKHAVGDIVVQGGKKYRATAVDKDGKVTAADEVKS